MGVRNGRDVSARGRRPTRRTRPGLVSPDIRVEIGELVLDGFTPADREGTGDALRLELARLFSEQGVPHGLRTTIRTEHLDAGAVVLRKEAIGRTGRVVARAVYRGFDR